MDGNSASQTPSKQASGTIKLYLAKTGQGGSTISQWNEAGTFYQKFLARTELLGFAPCSELVPVIYLWYSLGINDALNGTPEATWLQAVKDLHARMRDELGYVTIFMTKFMDVSTGANFNDSIDAYAASDNMLLAIDASGTTTRDANHWDYAGMKVMASRLITASKLFGQHEGYLMRQTAMLSGSSAITPPADLPSIVRSPSTLSFTAGSSGGTIAVSLSIAPAATVNVAVDVSGGNLSHSPTTLSFTTSNWNTPQSFTITSPNDGTASGNRTGTVTLSLLTFQAQRRLLSLSMMLVSGVCSCQYGFARDQWLYDCWRNTHLFDWNVDTKPNQLRLPMEASWG
jgi:hypothetical protein